MSEELKKNTEKTLERFCSEQEQLEKAAFDILNLSDTIQNTAKKAMKSLEEPQKEEAVLAAKDCLYSMLEHISELNEAAHRVEAGFASQQENIEALQMAVDFLFCDWDT